MDKEIEMSFRNFWQEHFPALLSREDALQITGRQQSYSSIGELISYQDRVASVYGSYEPVDFQIRTLDTLLSQRAMLHGTLLSLGSGPGSYELWLLSERIIDRVVLVDISPNMIKSAEIIAQRLGISGNIQTICSSLEDLDLNESVDVSISVNSLHWDAGWRKWIKKAASYTKPSGLIFLTGSMSFPQSQITPEQFVGVAARDIQIKERGYLLPAQVIGKQRVQSTRYFLIGSKEMQKKKGKKK